MELDRHLLKKGKVELTQEDIFKNNMEKYNNPEYYDL
jgi:hypothetical protein